MKTTSKKNKKQHFTIIYSDCFLIGTNNHCIPKMKTIYCERDKIVETIEKDNDIGGMSAVSFIFEGKPKLV